MILYFPNLVFRYFSFVKKYINFLFQICILFKNCKDWVHARSLPRPKRFVLPKAKPIPSSCTSSNSKISIPRPAMRRNRVVFSKTSHNYASSTNETMKPHAIQKLTKNRSHRILSLHHGNVNDKVFLLYFLELNNETQFQKFLLSIL